MAQKQDFQQKISLAYNEDTRGCFLKGARQQKD